MEIERIRLKERRMCGSTSRFLLGNTTKLKYTRVHSKLRHATPYLFRPRVKRKSVKHFNYEIAFNAHFLHYSLEKPKQHMTTDIWETILKRSSTTIKRIPRHLEYPMSLEGNCFVSVKGPVTHWSALAKGPII